MIVKVNQSLTDSSHMFSVQVWTNDGIFYLIGVLYYDQVYINIKFGSLSYKFNNLQVGCIRVNRGWSDFLSYPPTTELIRKICIEAMEYFNSSEAIYLSDSG